MYIVKFEEQGQLITMYFDKLENVEKFKRKNKVIEVLYSDLILKIKG